MLEYWRMKKIFLLLLIAIVVIALGYFVLNYSQIDSQDAGKADGIVAEINLEGVALDGPALVTIEREGKESRIIAVPSMGILLCPAAPNIADVFALSVGDIVSVSGNVDEEGRIVPCENEDHYLKANSIVSDDTLGYEFVYPKGPDGYVMFEDTESQHSDFVSGVMLFNAKEYEEFKSSTDAREGPASIHVRVYKNSQNSDAPVWAMQNPLETNIEFALGEPKEAVVGGANAEYYVVDGLFLIDTYVVAHGGNIYVLMGAYPDKTSKIYQDFQSIVDSFTFIQTPDQV